MYGFSKEAETTLSFLAGKEICQVAIGSYDVQFGWGNGGVSVLSKFPYRPNGSSDQIVWTAGNPESATRTVRLLKASITSSPLERSADTCPWFSNGDPVEIVKDER
jgi:hypothetical protein